MVTTQWFIIIKACFVNNYFFNIVIKNATAAVMRTKNAKQGQLTYCKTAIVHEYLLYEIP